ncbi:MAG: EVE domain-containing protein [Akkermansiaceae bacterium]|nr:EVE domain-containing protein [Akkermansiaceae bacterium]
MNYWLIKSEPDVFSIDDLKKVKREPWDGVRNYQARNFMMKEMKPGDLALFYHSNAKPPGVAGIAKVASETYPDPTQFKPKAKYYDPKSKKDNPRWWLVDFEFVKKFKEEIPLETLKNDKQLSEMMVCQKGSRLSITPVEAKHYKRIIKLAGA